ncbi:MAG: IclR family transcriptional regulator [Allosphingosinicella sp.]|uniref:IclR family transcriptional regulator n=1 Tax=Allosphingosinicella sp. TaxID=2823234 RepID=UPI0039326AF4
MTDRGNGRFAPGDKIAIVPYDRGSSRESGVAQSSSGTVARGGGKKSDAKPSADKTVVVKPVSNAIRILRYLGELGSPARAINIARHLSINASTCFNILRTLVLEGIVDFDPLSKTYTTGIGLTRLVENLLTEGQRIAAIIPHMREVASEFSVTVTLWKRHGPDRIVLVKSETSPTNLRIEMAEGQHLPVLMGSTGRVIAPHLGLGNKQLKALFRTIRWQRSLSFEEYWKQVEDARERGFAVDEGYFSRGIRTMAVPVYDRAGSVTFTLVAVMVIGQHDEASIERLGAALKEQAAKLTNLLF